MEFLKNIKRRSLLHEVTYIMLNIGLAVLLMVLIKVTGSIWPSFILVLLSKWRVFAVRLRFWFANIQANLVSTIVSVSYVVFLYIVNFANTSQLNILILQIILVIADVAWLLFLKPKSKRKYIAAQAGVALFAGITAIYAISYSWVATPVVLLVWLVGYAAARQVLTSYDEESHTLLLSSFWGFFLAEIGWIAYHWTVAYQLPVFTNVLLPQVSLVTFLISFIAYKYYDSYVRHEKIKMNDIILPLIFTICLVFVLLFKFNCAGINGVCF